MDKKDFISKFYWIRKSFLVMKTNKQGYKGTLRIDKNANKTIKKIQRQQPKTFNKVWSYLLYRKTVRGGYLTATLTQLL